MDGSYLYIMRHGEAKSDFEDPRRPLNSQGQKEVTAVAKLLGQRPESIHLIFHSEKARAQETAEILAGTLEPGNGTKEVPNITPMADPEVMVEKIKELKENLVLVSHLPYVSRLVSRLVVGNAEASIVNFTTATCAILHKLGGSYIIEGVVNPDLVRRKG